MFGKVIADIIINCVINGLQKTHSGKAGRVVLPVIYIIIGIFLVIGGTVISFLGWLNREDKWALGAFIAFALTAIFGFGLILAWCNCRIKYDDRKFVVKNFWGIQKQYSYADLTTIIEKKDGYRFILREGKVNIDKFAVGAYEFACFAREAYFESHNGHALKWIYQ